jgi:16S rRNA (cytidine1402-2'-O)-methyltransferase
VVATPIGNLSDITLRALHVLELADTIACEDTRHTQALLRAYGIHKTGSQLLAVHQHNEAESAQPVIALLQQGQRVAYVSDAGTPGVSDPGARLVAAVHAAGYRTLPLPGASSITSALSVAGIMAANPEHNGFIFAGFAPTKAAERATWVAQWADEPRSIVLLEAPHRIVDLAAALGVLGERPVTLARELTKQFEEVTTHAAQALADWLAGAPQRAKGEFVVVIHPAPRPAVAENAQGLAVLQLLLQELPLKTAVRLAAEISGAPRNALYNTALEWKRAGDTAADDEAP